MEAEFLWWSTVVFEGSAGLLRNGKKNENYGIILGLGTSGVGKYTSGVGTYTSSPSKMPFHPSCLLDETTQSYCWPWFLLHFCGNAIMVPVLV